MTEYRVPFETAETEFIEKRSRFIGHVWRVSNEAEARERIEEMKKKHHDARHNCWCYLIKESGVMRYSDDGEPQGTAGMPMLEVFRRQEVYNVCCVVTRYFGGILLGAGGLTRAYARSAGDALATAGVCWMKPWVRWDIPCTYSLFERLKLEIANQQGVVETVDYGADLLLHVALPEEAGDTLTSFLTELSAGSLTMTQTGTAFLPGQREETK